MKEKALSVLSLTVLIVIGIAGLFMAWYGQTVSSRFLLALFPLLVVLIGVAFLRQSGLVMACVGLVLVVVLAVFQFGTPVEVALGASAFGFLKSFDISVSVAATMLMIFLMKEAGALGTVSKVIKRQVVGNEIRALYIGIGFGSFLTSLGVVTPALFPPLLVAMGFSPTASVAIAVLWLVGGRSSMRKGAVPATMCGLVLAMTCLGTVSLDYFTGVEYVPLRLVGVLAGLCAMASLLVYQKLRPKAVVTEKDIDYPTRSEVFRAFSPWIILTALAVIVSVPQVGAWLSNLLGDAEKVTVFADQKVDFDFLSRIYTWIFVAILLSLFTLKLTRKQIGNALRFWLRRFWGPFLAFGLYFSISFVMADSAMYIVNAALKPILGVYGAFNMNVILGVTLASAFGAGYIFVAASLGLFGAIVGGSEASSNVLFMKIQKTASSTVGLGDAGFMTVYGSHAVAGGIASAVTPAKINNAVVTIDAGKETESLIMRRHLVVALLLTLATGILTGILVNIGI